MALTIQTTDRHKVTGTARAGADITIENQSAAPFAPGDVPSLTVRADAQGHFEADLGVGETGDLVRIRSGRDEIDVRLGGTHKARRPEGELQGLRLIAGTRGRVDICRVIKSDRVSEPGAKLVISKRGTTEKRTITLDHFGRLPPNAALKGKLGDVFDIVLTTVTGKATMGKAWATLVVGADATPAAADRGHGRLAPTVGKAEVRGISFDDPKQGDVGDCWFVSALSAIALRDPGAIARMLKTEDDGSITVTFQAYDPTLKRYVPHRENVALSFFKNEDGELLYGDSADANELWFAVIEKAYAQWKGGYAAIACGYPFTAFEACLGAAGTYFTLEGSRAKTVEQTLRRAEAENRPIVTCSRPDAKLEGLVEDHAYAVLGFKDGCVLLRNPWGRGEPKVKNRGKDDGVFPMPLAQFMELFYYLCIGPKTQDLERRRVRDYRRSAWRSSTFISAATTRRR